MKQPVLIAAFLFLLGIPFAQAADGVELNRKVMGFYDASLYTDSFFTPLHQQATMPLNYLGLIVTPRPIQDPLPSDAQMKGYLGILTWFERVNAAPDPVAYCSWLGHQLDAGLKLVILGEAGFSTDLNRKIGPECQAVYRRLGVEYKGEYAPNPFFLEVVKKEPEMVEFERSLNFSEGLVYSAFAPLSFPIKTYLEVKRLDMPNSNSALIFTSQAGGMAYQSYINYYRRDLGKIQWRLNPFLFFAEAFGVKDWPYPDTTTLNGRRLYFSHIDGDGIFNISYLDRKTFAGQEIAEKIIKPNADLPISIGIITGYLDQPTFNTPKHRDIYSKLLAPPNVEVASHGYAHPLVWSTHTVALQIPGYQYSAQKEIEGSVNMLAALLADLKIDKPVSLFQWTGNCLPQLSDIQLAYRAGLLNINGGDSRFDRKLESYSFVSPLGIWRDGVVQIYSAAPNEVVYTNLWKGPFYGQKDVIETFKNTESPRRLKPINIYYHFFSGERLAALETLKSLYAYARSQPIFPVQTSQYVRIANDFYRLRLFKLGDGYRVMNDGELRTIRFDQEKRNVDMESSKGVIGFKKFQGSLYVFLDESAIHDVKLTSKAPQRAFVEESNFFITDFKASPKRVSLKKKGWGIGELKLGGMAAHRKYRVTFQDQKTEELSNADGELKVRFLSAVGSTSEVALTLELL